MTTTTPPEHGSAKLLGRARLKLQIGAGCLAILGVGSWTAPKQARGGPPAAEERAAPLLEEQAHEHAAAELFRAVADVAGRVGGHAVRFDGPGRRATGAVADFELGEPGPPPVFGVFVSATRILTHIDGLPPQTVFSARLDDGRRVDVSIAAFDRASGLVLLAAPAGLVAPPVLATGDPAPGTLLIGVAGTAADRVVAPAFLTQRSTGRLRLDAAAGRMPVGLPLFDLDGRLVGITGGRTEAEAFAVADAMRTLALSTAAPAPRAFGLAFRDRAGLLAELYGPAGVVVDDVVEGGPAHRAGLAAGDLVLTVADAPVDDAAAAMRAFQTAAADGRTLTVSVRPFGARQPRVVDVSPSPAVIVAILARARPPAPGGTDAAAIFTRAALDGAGVNGASRVLGIDGAAIGSREDALRYLRRRRTPVAVLLSGERGRFVAAIDPRP
jgi:S1-C subfamily serine protease